MKATYITVMLIVVFMGLHGIGRYKEYERHNEVMEHITELHNEYRAIKDELRTHSDMLTVVDHWVSPRHIKDKDGKCDVFFCPCNDRKNIGMSLEERRMRNHTFLNPEEERQWMNLLDKIRNRRVEVEDAIHQ